MTKRTVDEKGAVPLGKPKILTRYQRARLVETTLNVLSHWECCEAAGLLPRRSPGCMDQMVNVLTGLTGIEVIPVEIEVENSDGEMVAACLQEFAAAVNIEEFMRGNVRPSRALILYRGPTPAPPILYEPSAELEDYLGARGILKVSRAWLDANARS